MTQLALTLDIARGWNSRWNGDYAIARRWVDFYLKQLRARSPPPVIINHTVTDVDLLGMAPRLYWSEGLDQFDPRSMTMIYLNGSVGKPDLKTELVLFVDPKLQLIQRVNDMMAAEARGLSQRFRDYQFLFSTVIIHEVGGHVLVTFFRQGDSTPQGITVPRYGQESGRWLEMHLLGGTTEFYRDYSQDDGQVGETC